MQAPVTIAIALALGMALSACASSPVRVAFSPANEDLAPTRTTAVTPGGSCANEWDIVGRRSAILGTPLSEHWAANNGC